MKRLLFLALGLLLGATSAYAQNPVLQSGTVIRNHAAKWIDHETVQDAGPWSGGGPSVGISDLPLVGVGTPLCIYDAPVTNSLGYHSLCLGANDGNKGTINFSSGGAATPIPLKLCYNGQCYDFPFTGYRYCGPNPSTMNEIASWNNTTGTLLRQGPAGITDSKTAAQTTDSGTLSISTQPGITAMSIANAVCGGTAGCNYRTNDAIRGVNVAELGSTVVGTNAIAGYLRNKNVSGTPPSFGENSVIMFGSGTCEVNGCKTWGFNSVLVDSAGKGLPSGPNRVLVGAEYDFIASAATTNVIGIMVTGDSLVQPTLANAYTVLPLGQQSGPNPVRWINGFITASGAAAFSLVSGASQVSGNDVESQKIIFSYYDNTGAPGSVGLGVGTNLAFAGNTPQLTFTSTAPTADVVLPGMLKLKSFPPGAIEMNGHIVLQAGANAAGNDIFIGNAATIANVAVGGINAVLTLGGSSINMNPISGLLSIQALPAVAAGTGKRFLCIDTLSKRVYEGSGTSCN